MADEYISREAVLNSTHSGDIDMGMVTTHEYRLLKDLSERIDRRIQRVPVSDVAPARHGWWIKTIGENGVTSACRCNLCGFEDNRFSLFNYCPNCGAKMDGDVNGGTDNR